MAISKIGAKLKKILLFLITSSEAVTESRRYVDQHSPFGTSADRLKAKIPEFNPISMPIRGLRAI
jgi:hypothetical protein